MASIRARRSFAPMKVVFCLADEILADGLWQVEFPPNARGGFHFCSVWSLAKAFLKAKSERVLAIRCTSFSVLRRTALIKVIWGSGDNYQATLWPATGSNLRPPPGSEDRGRSMLEQVTAMEQKKARRPQRFTL